MKLKQVDVDQLENELRKTFGNDQNQKLVSSCRI